MGEPDRRQRRLALMTIVVLLAAGLVGCHQGRPSATGPAVTIPPPPVLGPARDVYDGDLGDPFVLPVTTAGQPTSFVAFGTGDWPARVPTAHSADLIGWHAGPDAMPQLPAWASPDPKNSLSWAPAALDTGHGYVLYVTLHDANSRRQCIAVATSMVADGPYVGVGDGPLICQRRLGGSIDPSLVQDGAGQVHLVWKSDGNAVGAPGSVWEQQLSADGLGLVGTAHRLLTASQAWQRHIIEQPAMMAAAVGGWWLFYSGNVFDKPEYATGLAYCPTLEGPCREAGRGPFLATAGLHQPRLSAPGGLETFTDGAGARWAVFDTWNRPTRNGHFYCCRSLELAPIQSS